MQRYKTAITLTLLGSVVAASNIDIWQRQEASHFCCSVNTLKSTTVYKTQSFPVVKSIVKFERGVDPNTNPIFKHSEHSWFLGIPADPPKDKYSVEYHMVSEYKTVAQTHYHEDACPAGKRHCCQGYKYVEKYNNCLSDKEIKDLEEKFGPIEK